MALNGFERLTPAAGQRLEGNFVIRNTNAEQYHLGGTIGSVTLEVTSISSLGTRTLTFRDVNNVAYSATCAAGTAYASSTHSVIGTSGVDSLTKLAIAITTSIQSAIDNRDLMASVSRDGTEVTIKRSHINNGAVTITTDAIGGTMYDENVELAEVSPTNSLKGKIIMKPPFSLGRPSVFSLRGRTTAYRVSRGEQS